MRAALFAAMLLATTAAGCLTEPEPDPVETEPAFAGGKETNGRWLIGEHLDALGDATYHLAVSTSGFNAAGKSVAVYADGIVGIAGTWDGATHRGADPDLVGLRLPTVPAPGELKLTGVRSDGGVTRYTIVRRASSTAPWLDPCAGGEALVTAGRWTRTGDHELTTTHLTFACAGGGADAGAVAKCIDVGYRPGAGSELDLGWRAHQACTRALRADVCGNGITHTREGTEVTFYDRAGVHPAPPASYPPITSWPPPHNEEHFDGGWGVDGMVCGGKARWQSLALGGDCPGTLPDPRLDRDARMCDDGEPLTDQRILIETTATFNELALHLWRNGDDHVVTVRGFHSVTAGAQPPFPGYTYVGPDAYLLRSVPASVDASELIQVNLYRGPGGDHVVAAAPPAAGYVDLGTEGWIFNWNRGGTIPLRRFTGPTGDRVSSTLTPPAPGYTAGALVGNTIAP